MNAGGVCCKSLYSAQGRPWLPARCRKDLFMFDGSPKTLDEDIVPPRAFSVHADLDLPVGQHFDKLRRSKLATLIRVE